MALSKRSTGFIALLFGPPIALNLFARTTGIYLNLDGFKWLVLFAYVVLCVVIFHSTAPRSPLADLPQPPPPTSIFGHARKVIFQDPKGSVFAEWTDTVPNDGIIYFAGLPFGIGPALLLTSPEALREFFVTRSYEFAKTEEDQKLLQSVIGRGLITVEGAEHKKQRKSVTPAFSGKHINDLIVPVFWAKSKELATVIASQLHTTPNVKAGGAADERTGVVDVNRWSSHVTLDIIGLACVGRDFASIHNADDEIVRMYELIFKTEGSRGWDIVLKMFTSYLPIWLARCMPSKQIREFVFAKERVRELCRDLLAAKKKDMEAESAKHIDILSVLIRSGQFTDDGLIDQLLTFLAAGHETTAGALTWTLYLLAINPTAQEHLRQELQQHFATGEQDDLVSSLDNLPYLNAVISEQLRLIPIVPTTGRRAAQDTMLLGHLLPKGTTVIAAPWAINRSKIHWGPDADQFRPERWLQENVGDTKRTPMHFLTFLHGPRSCIGQAFSRAELRCLIAAMVLRFNMQMADPSEVVEPTGLVTIKPKNGMRLWLKEL